MSKLKTSTIIWTIIVCIFVGIFLISGGLGTALPQVNYIAKPFVCLNGQLSFGQNAYSPIPGYTSTRYSVDWICTDSKSGSQTPIESLKMSVLAGPFYGLLLFLVMWLLLPGWFVVQKSEQRLGSR